jgi:hypothetical protein
MYLGGAASSCHINMTLQIGEAFAHFLLHSHSENNTEESEPNKHQEQKEDSRSVYP